MSNADSLSIAQPCKSGFCVHMLKPVVAAELLLEPCQGLGERGEQQRHHWHRLRRGLHPVCCRRCPAACAPGDDGSPAITAATCACTTTADACLQAALGYAAYLVPARRVRITKDVSRMLRIARARAGARQMHPGLRQGGSPRRELPASAAVVQPRPVFICSRGQGLGVLSAADGLSFSSTTCCRVSARHSRGGCV